MGEPVGGGDRLKAQRPPKCSNVVAVRGGPCQGGGPQLHTGAGHARGDGGIGGDQGHRQNSDFREACGEGVARVAVLGSGAAAGASHGGGDTVADLPQAGVRAGEGRGHQQWELPDSGQAVVCPTSPEGLGLGSGPVGKQNRPRQPENDEDPPRREPEAAACSLGAARSRPVGTGPRSTSFIWMMDGPSGSVSDGPEGTGAALGVSGQPGVLLT